MDVAEPGEAGQLLQQKCGELTAGYSAAGRPSWLTRSAAFGEKRVDLSLAMQLDTARNRKGAKFDRNITED